MTVATRSSSRGRRQALLDEVTAGREGMTGMQLDLNDPASLPRLADGIRTRFPELNVLVANAGISSMEDLVAGCDMSVSETIVQTNILGTLRGGGDASARTAAEAGGRDYGHDLKPRLRAESRLPDLLRHQGPSCTPGCNRCATSSAALR